MDEIYTYALKLLAGRDYSVARLQEKLAAKFGENENPESVIGRLIAQNFLNDRRYAEEYVARRQKRGRLRLQEELTARGIAPQLVAEALSAIAWPSLHEAVKATIVALNLRAPLQTRDAARLFRALHRLGYEEDAIQEEVEQFHEQ